MYGNPTEQWVPRGHPITHSLNQSINHQSYFICQNEVTF